MAALISGVLLLVLSTGSAEAKDPCKGLDAESCATQALSSFDRPAVACLEGDRQACSAATALLRHQPAPSAERALEAWKRACELGDTEACERAEGKAARPTQELRVRVSEAGLTVRLGEGEPQQLPCSDEGACASPLDLDVYGLSRTTWGLLEDLDHAGASARIEVPPDLPPSVLMELVDAVQRHPSKGSMVAEVRVVEVQP